MMIKIIVAGFKGKMGATVVKMVADNEHFELIGVYDPFAEEKNLNEVPIFSNLSVPVFREKESLAKELSPDIWIDFTAPSAAFENTKFALEQGIRPVVGTTGFSEDEVEKLKDISRKNKVGGLIAPNFAIGAVLMMEFSAKAAKYFPNVEIIELHHDNKLDAPSGTAIKTAEMIYEERGDQQQGNPDEKETISGARGADFKGMKIHSVRLPGLIAHQQVQFGHTGEGLIIRHDSYDRSSFMSGVALGCEKVIDANELVYGLENFL